MTGEERPLGHPFKAFPHERYGRLGARGAPANPTTRYARAGAVLIAGAWAFMMVDGWYRMPYNLKLMRSFKEEKNAARHAIVPVLQAEEDARYVKADQARREFEQQLMKDVPGWEMHKRPYNTTNWTAPTSRGFPVYLQRS
eukprot:TRINITY_DN4971_c0_g1_i1.p1 TRINITY_DN4971_c0_g1~~TRINITY_DN4971_c0_g1_i1.p1  ORF type:complete len:141 (-),score=29.68 TRINITY_DN4971_c0_g1_i1:108-530(-)